VPEGVSGWEISAESGVAGKLGRDLRERTRDPLGLEPARTTFVFVTPRRVGNPSLLLAKLPERDRWREVRVVDANILVQWLEQRPAVALWLGRLLGKAPEGAESLEERHERWLAATSRPLGRGLLLAGREAEAAALLDLLGGPPTAVTVRADSTDEMLAFVHAALEGAGALATRAAVVRGFEAWRTLQGSREPLVLLADAEDRSLVGPSVERGHHVVVPHASTSGRATITLPRLSYHRFAEALRGDGLSPEEADHLSLRSGQSLTVLHRCLARVPTLPPWARAADPVLTALLLAGGFQAGREADERVVASLVPSGPPIGDIQRRLAELAQQPEVPPVLRIGELWTLTAPYDAWSRLGRYVTADDLGRFRDACLAVLGERDPSLDLRPEERWLAGVRGKLPRHSGPLREGLARSLVLLAKVGEAAGVAAEPSPAAWAERIVRDLFGREPDADRWRSLSAILTQLAAAAPDLFLGSVEASLARPDRPVMALFEEKGGPLSPGSRHPPLLWALESLAWDPRRLGRVALALGHLAALDPGGRLGNRPAGSLRALFLPWFPQTEADLAARLAAIDVLLAREPEVGLALLADLLPTGLDHASHTAGPEWDDRPVVRRQAPASEEAACVGAVLDRLVPRLGDHPAYWSRLVTGLGWYPTDRAEALLERLEAVLPTLPAPSREEVRATLRRGLAYRGRDADDDGWAPRLRAILLRSEPFDLPERHRWLFDTAWLDPKGEDATGEAPEERRSRAVDQILATQGVEGILRLAESANHPYLVGHTLGARGWGEGALLSLLGRTLGASSPKLCELGRALVGRLVRDGRDGRAAWLLEAAARLGWSDRQRTDLLLGLPTGARIWDEAAKLGAGVEASYWSQVHVHGCGLEGDEATRAVRRLLDEGRPGAALDTACTAKAELPGPLLVKLLDALAGWLNAGNAGETNLRSWEVETAFAALDRCPDAPEGDIVRLEWIYFPLLERSRRGPRALRQTLHADPQIYVDLLTAYYLPDEPEQGSDRFAGLDDGAKRVLVGRAGDVLRWFSLFQPSANGVAVTADRLVTWVAAVREGARSRSRARIADFELGRMLARAPEDEDGVWPAGPVRDLAESVWTDDLARGLRIGLWNKRGVTTRAIDDGGDQERALAARYRGWGDRLIAGGWFRLASALHATAADYDREARREDQAAERRRRRP
jgi:hypothetical protein